MKFYLYTERLETDTTVSGANWCEGRVVLVVSGGRVRVTHPGALARDTITKHRTWWCV